MDPNFMQFLLARSNAVCSQECRGADGQPVTPSEHEGSLRASPPFVEHFDRDPSEVNVKIKYEGGILNGQMNGKGTIEYMSGEDEGSKYVGDFQFGKKHGKGTFSWIDGKKYKGEFRSDKMTGKGTLTWSNGKLIGEFLDGKIILDTSVKSNFIPGKRKREDQEEEDSILAHKLSCVDNSKFGPTSIKDYSAL